MTVNVNKMAEEDAKMSSETTITSPSEGRRIDREEENKMPERTEDIAVGAEDEEKEVAEENGKENEDNNEAGNLQNIEAKDPEELTGKDRLVLYEKGVRLKRKGNNKHALPCFLSCLQGLKERDHFPVLPECLHNIAEIYSQEEEYEAAIQFAQAEKLYYETALITVDNKAELDANASNIDITSSEARGSPSANSTDAQKAEEYEKLAHMCLKQQNPQLALDYCAKAVKLQQSCYGEQHPVTLKTLDLFTVIYAEMGKQQYKAALEKFSAAQEKEKEAKASKKTPNENAGPTEDATQEKHRIKESDQTTRTEMEDVKQGHKQEQTESTTEETTSTSQDTVKVTMTSSQALMLYFIITILLAVILTTGLCYMTQTDLTTTYNYMITRIRFYYYYYFKRNGSNGHQYF
ncbi:uncharacterized protein LOC116294899 [Actinia tenebrosa]|uniref:Uncharacterized protein LOC116294899 n=1 Tax=Actinia tenebrosa TaxID=6105 RepID=A0A6P8HT91_ACTTE|nr:uncharacterized protein LOC116294899 [Actinia tenebrosa]